MEGNNQLSIEVVTPEGVAFSGPVLSCRAPGISGGFQVLPGHTSLLSALKIGPLKLKTPAQEDKYIAISGGFFEINKNNITVLADAAEISEKIDIDRADKAKNRALERLKETQQDVDIKRAEAALARALNRLKIVKNIS